MVALYTCGVMSNGGVQVTMQSAVISITTAFAGLLEFHLVEPLPKQDEPRAGPKQPYLRSHLFSYANQQETFQLHSSHTHDIVQF